ncbi:hypothetical protein HK096_009141, partial [Nowakowskiella sp. JEL0078]
MKDETEGISKKERKIKELRTKIDSIDSRIVSLLNERALVSVNLKDPKKLNELPNSASQMDIDSHPHVPARELAIYDNLKKLNANGPLPQEALQSIYREIMSASISLQHKVSVAYLGPTGTYCHQAAIERFGDNLVFIPQTTIADIFTATEEGTTTYGVIPFENSTFGSVVQTLDRFIQAPLKNIGVGASHVVRAKVQVRADHFLTIHHCLLSNAADISSIKRVYSHPEALGQCQRWLDSNLRHAERSTVSSTSRAAELASSETDSAAICSIVCSDLYGIKIVAKNIEDLKTNTTRFFILGATSDSRLPDSSQESLPYRTLLFFTVDHRQPGALCDALAILKSQ